MLVEDLEWLVEKRTGDSHIIYYLRYACQTLEKGRKLSSYGIGRSSTIQQCFSMSGMRRYEELRAKEEEAVRTNQQGSLPSAGAEGEGKK